MPPLSRLYKDRQRPANGPYCDVAKELCGDTARARGHPPYQTIVDLTNIAFKCSCPSHKFPCKHALGLLLLYARSESAFAQEDEPEWVTSWIDKRAETAEKKAQREERKKEGEKVKDPKQAERRQANRHPRSWRECRSWSCG